MTGDTERLKTLQAELALHEDLVTSFVRLPGKPVALRVADAKASDLYEDITCTVEDGRIVCRWSWHRALAGEDLTEQAGSVAAVLQAKLNFSA